MDALPSFTTSRLILRPRGPCDVEACVAMDSDPEVRRYLPADIRDDFDAEEHRQVLSNRTRMSWGPGLGYWVIESKADVGVFCGWIMLTPLADEGPGIEIGWRLPQLCWGRGFATEAASTILRYGFATLGLDEIIAVIDPENLRSKRVATRIGLRAIGRKRAYGVDLELYAFTNTEFAQGK